MRSAIARRDPAGDLAAFYGLADFTKVSTAPANLVTMGTAYAADAHAAPLLFIGTAEMLGALGLLLQGLTKIRRSNG